MIKTCCVHFETGFLLYVGSVWACSTGDRKLQNIYKTALITQKYIWDILAVSTSPDNICDLSHQSRLAVACAPWLLGIYGLASGGAGLEVRLKS